MTQFVAYLLCMWAGAIIGVFAVALGMAASTHFPDDDYPND